VSPDRVREIRDSGSAEKVRHARFHRRRAAACYSETVIPPEARPLFWDCRPDQLDLETHAPFILGRVLEYGSLASVRWAIDIYGTERIKTFLRERGRRTLSRKTLAFWTLILGLEAEPCFEKSSLTRSRIFWNY
jgi:uncharacterized protein DUF6922